MLLLVLVLGAGASSQAQEWEEAGVDWPVPEIPDVREVSPAVARARVVAKATALEMGATEAEAEQAAFAKVQEKFGPMLQQMQHQQRIQTTLAQVRQDPLMNDVYGEIHGWLKSMPEDFAKETYQRLDRLFTYSSPASFVLP